MEVCQCMHACWIRFEMIEIQKSKNASKAGLFGCLLFHVSIKHKNKNNKPKFIQMLGEHCWALLPAASSIHTRKVFFNLASLVICCGQQCLEYLDMNE